MKKVLIAAALAAGVSCTKTVVYDGVSEIGFRPVAETPRTRTVYGPMAGAGYDAAESFNVFAYHSNGESGQSWSEFKGGTGGVVVYIYDGTFAKQASGNYWGGSPTAYWWPKTGSLMFAGYSPVLSDTGTEGAPGYGNVSYDINGSDGPALSIQDFVQGNYSYTAGEYKMVDLMWFGVDDDGTLSVNNSGNPSTAVPVKFHHALSWLTFKFMLAEGCSDSFYIISATLDGILCKGSFTGKKDGAFWTADGERTSYNLVPVQTGALTEDGIETGDLLVIPYDFTVDGSYILTVKFKQGEPADGLEQTISYALNLNDVKTWEAGKHYTYTVTMSSAEILLDPAVTEWEGVSAGGITVS